MKTALFALIALFFITAPTHAEESSSTPSVTACTLDIAVLSQKAALDSFDVEKGELEELFTTARESDKAMETFFRFDQAILEYCKTLHGTIKKVREGKN